MFIFQSIRYSNVVICFYWLRNRPSIKYVRNGNGGGKSRMCTGAYRERGVKKSVIRYVRTKWMAPSKVCGIFSMKWFGQVHQSITASKKNVVVFSDHNYDYFIPCDNYNLVSCLYIRISTKKRHSIFLKEILTQMFL